MLSLLILIAWAAFRCSSYRSANTLKWFRHCCANFPGANPKVIGDTVAAPLEQAITGVENMLYVFAVHR